jgi:hypothetical protein
MDEDGQPSWLSSNKQTSSSSAPEMPPAPLTPASGKAGGSAKAAVNLPPYFMAVQVTMTVINMGLMIFMAAVGVLGVLNANNVDDTGVIFVGIYLVIFAGIEFMYELAQVQPLESLDTLVKKNFGFLYGLNGRGCFFLLVGVLCFGLSTPRQLAIAAGVTIAFWGCLIMVVGLLKPDYFPRKEKYIPP